MPCSRCGALEDHYYGAGLTTPATFMCPKESKMSKGDELFEALKAARKVIRETRAAARQSGVTSNIPYMELGVVLRQITKALG
jgi:hypothetical protein